MSITDIDTSKHVIFQVAEQVYGLNVEKVFSIEKLTHITRIPNQPSHIKGVINLRGIIIPIIDVRLRVGLNLHEYNDNARIIVTEENNKKLGLIVDIVKDVIDISLDTIEKSVDNKNDIINNVVKVEDELIALIDLSKI